MCNITACERSVSGKVAAIHSVSAQRPSTFKTVFGNVRSPVTMQISSHSHNFRVARLRSTRISLLYSSLWHFSVVYETLHCRSPLPVGSLNLFKIVTLQIAMPKWLNYQ